jgi:hypothetical protein
MSAIMSMSTSTSMVTNWLIDRWMEACMRVRAYEFILVDERCMTVTVQFSSVQYSEESRGGEWK